MSGCNIAAAPAPYLRSFICLCSFMLPHFSSFRFLAALLALAACTETTTTETKTGATAPTETMESTAAALDSTPAPAAAARVPAPPRPPAKAFAAPDTAYAQDVAAYLAGLPASQHSDLNPLAATPAYRAFAQDQARSWLKYTTTHTTPMTRWAATQLDSAQHSSPTIFYPFSGPDFLNVVTMFPASDTYVMVGLEPVGSVPARASLENPKLFPAIKSSLWSVLNFSFFRTNDMAIDLKSVELDGAVPLLILFAARTGHQLLAIRPVRLTATGQLQPTDTTQAPDPKTVPGAEIKLRAPDGHPQTLYYFSADLSDSKLSVQPAALKFVQSLGPLTTYVKSASYLMHKTYFSQIRRLVLRHSRYILQDDSGIAMKYFQKGAWNFTHYGTYRRPINLFAKHYQPELTAAYQDSLHLPQKLPFGTGYNWQQKDSNMLIARRLIPLAE